MARTFALRIANDTMPSHMFDVDAPVGEGAANNRADVLLVQYLLAIWMASSKDPAERAIIMKAPVVVVDGICGKNTIGAIRAFEEANPRVIKDGRVHPFNTPMSSIAKILVLNMKLFFAGGLRGPVPKLAIEFPQELIPLLFRP
mgnify:CR=1 FL=1